MLQVRQIKSNEEFTQLEQIWNNLLLQSPVNNYFMSWYWLWNWWQVFAEKGDELAILLLERKGEVVGIAPFYIRKKLLGGIFPVRRMMFLGTQEDGEGDVCSDYMDAIYKDGDEKELISYIFNTVVGQNICDEIYLSKMDTSSKTFALFQEAAKNLRFLNIIHNEFISPYIKLPATWENYLNSLTSSMRYKIRNERRKLKGQQTIVFKKAENHSELKEGFEELVRLHQKRWESRGIAGAFSSNKFTMFHNRIMPLMMKRGQLQLTSLLADNKYVGVAYNIMYNKKIYFYQSGIDIHNSKSAFGYVLHSYCIEEAIKNGLAEYDFLPKGGMDDYKDRFSTHFRKVSDIYIACNGIVKHFVKAKESARSVYYHIKPYFS